MISSSCVLAPDSPSQPKADNSGPSQIEVVAPVAGSTPSVPAQPTQSIPKPAQTLAKTAGADPQRTQNCKRRNQHRQPASDEESALPSNDDLLEKIHVVKQTLLAMQEAGKPIGDDTKIAMANCCLLAKHINSNFGLPAPSRAGAATLRVIATAAESPTLPGSTNRNGSSALEGPGATVPESAPVAKPIGKRRRAAKRPVGMPPEPTAPLPGPDDAQPPLFPRP